MEAPEGLPPGALRIEGGGAGQDALTIHRDIGGQGLGALDAPEHLPRQGNRWEVTAAQRVHRIDQTLEMKFGHPASPSPPPGGPRQGLADLAGV